MSDSLTNEGLSALQMTGSAVQATSQDSYIDDDDDDDEIDYFTVR